MIPARIALFKLIPTRFQDGREFGGKEARGEKPHGIGTPGVMTSGCPRFWANSHG